MHNAPAVSYPVGRPVFAALLAAGLWLAGAAVTGWWWLQADAPGWRQATASLAVVITGAFALWSWLRSPSGDLHWHGGAWTAPHGTDAGSLEVALDLQQVLLVQWHAHYAHQAHHARKWLWLERQRCPQRWLDVRRAVYSRARPHALTAALPPSATP